MDSRIQDRKVFDIASQGGAKQVGFYCEEITGDEDESMDSWLQEITQQGNRVIDWSIIIDADLFPPVSGWVIYKKETAK